MIVITVKTIVKEHVLVHKLVPHAATNEHFPDGMLLAGYTKLLLVKLVQ